MARKDEEDLTPQRERLAAARQQVAESLDDLIDEAKRAAKAARSKRGRPDLDRVNAAHRDVQRAEELMDLAAYDLATAGGADG